MDIKRAIWYLKDKAFTGFDSDLRTAIVTVLARLEELEKKNGGTNNEIENKNI